MEEDHKDKATSLASVKDFSSLSGIYNHASDYVVQNVLDFMQWLNKSL